MKRGGLWCVITVFSLMILACDQDRIPVGVASGDPHGEENHEAHDIEGTEAPGFVSMEEARHLGPIKVQPAQPRAVSGIVSATGEIKNSPDQVAHLTSRVSGWIHEVYVFQEDAVKKGEVLALMDSPQYLTAQTEYLMVLRRNQNATPGESRTEEALLSSAQQKLLILGAWDNDVETLTQSKSIQRYLPVRSPIAGTVIESQVVQGSAIQTNDHLFRIADLSTIWVLLDILEQDLVKVRKGAKVQVTTAAYPGEHFQGTLTLLGQTAQEATRTVQARVVAQNPAGKLRPGMFVQGMIMVPGDRAVLALPASALFLYQGQETVFIQKEHGYQATSVRTGRREGGWVEIMEGLEPKTPVVVEGGFSLKSQLLKESMGEGHVH